MKIISTPLLCRLILCALSFVASLPQVLAFAETDSLTSNTLSQRILKALNSNVAPAGTPFTEVASLTGVIYGDMEWGDYDNDNDLDLVVTGSTEDPNTGSTGFAKLYKNNGGVFSEDTGNELAQLSSGAVAWGDYDNDGDIDLMLTGNYSSLDDHATLVYNNNNGVLTALPGTTMPGVVRGGCNWVDMDNDGDLDIFIAGWTSLEPGTGTHIVRFYRNNAGTFDLIPYNVYNSQDGGYAFNDFDGDMDFDVIVTGGDNAFLFLNNLEAQFELSRAYDGLSNSSVVWADFDGDVDQDVIVSGQVNNVDAGVIRFYQNGGEMTLVDGDTGLDGHYVSSMTAGDYDNDGDLDILLTGFQAPTSSMNTNLYMNDGTGHFSLATNTGLTTPVRDGDAKWGDIDNDGDLDLIVVGSNSGWSERYTKIYTNETNAANAAPATPTNLKMVQTGNDMVFSWDAASDAEGGSVTYNLRIGTSPGGNQVMSSNSDGATGFHRIAEPGNVHNSLSWKIKDLGGLNYYWSVQAIDNSLKAGSFAAEQMTTTLYPPGYFMAEAGNEKVTLTWLNGNESGYNIIYRETEDTSNPTHVIAASVTGTSYTDTDVQNGTTYYYYIKAADSNGSATIAAPAIATPEFFSQVASFPTTQYGASAWGDYDSDGDYDVVVTGNGYPNPSYIKFYNNSNGVFEEVTGASLTSGNIAYASFIDYDNDNDLDLLHTSTAEPVTNLFKNEGGTFSVVANPNFPVGQGQKHAWGDMDNDGDLDLAVPGYENKIFAKNNKSDFSPAGELPSSYSMTWGDYDNDGDMDYAIGEGIFSNTNGTFMKVVSIGSGTVEWADIDNDHDLDLITSGVLPGASARAVIYRNDGDTFTAVEQPQISALYTGDIIGVSISPGDFDNDGDLDLLITGTINVSPYSTQAALYVNDGSGTYTKDDRLVLPQAASKSVAWGDYDRDGDLDILFYGWDFGNGNDTRHNEVYRNNLNVANTPPTVPSNLQATMSDSKITFSWDASTDTQGGPITYNLRVGTTPGGSEIMSAMANTTTGQLLLPQMGNVQLNRGWTLNGITAGDYYWSVQALDGSYVASTFASEQHITLAAQTITFEAFGNITVNQDPFDINASASSGLPLTFTSSDPAVATVSGNQVTIVSAGTTEITAKQVGDNSFAAATPVTRVLTVSKIDQTITFPALNARTVGDAAFALTATASSGLPVEFSTTSDNVTLSGNTVTIVKAGSVTVTADQPGDATYKAATPESQSFCINPAKPSIVESGENIGNIVLTSTATAGNQWYMDGAPVAGATQTTLTPSSLGNYSVKVTVDNCSSAMSDQISLVVTSVEETSNAMIRVYPNPATSRVTIELPPDRALRTLEVVYSDGRPALQALQTTKSTVELDVHELPPGLYIIHLQRLSKAEDLKFVKR